MGRGDIDKPRLSIKTPDDDSARINRKRSQPCAIGGEHTPSTLISRVLEAHLVARLDQKPGRQIQSLLRSADDNDLFGHAANCPESADIAGDFRTQSFVTSRSFDVVESRRRQPPHLLPHQSPPQRDRKVLTIGNTRREANYRTPV